MPLATTSVWAKASGVWTRRAEYPPSFLISQYFFRHRQIAASDVILLNKSDLVNPETLLETERMIRQINPAAPIYRTVKGEIDLQHIIGISAFRLPPPDVPADNHIHSDDCKDAHDHDAPPTHYELRGISSLQVTCGVLDQARLDRLDEWIRTALWENEIAGAAQAVKILRCKGAFTSDRGVHYVLQGVRSMYEISELPAGDSIGVPSTGKIVLIGKGLDDTARASLERVLS